MFGLFKNKEQKKKESEIDELGKLIFNQVRKFIDQYSNNFSQELTHQKLNSAYIAAYLIGFPSVKLNSIFNNDLEKAKYSERIIKGIFPKNGINLVKNKYQMRMLSDSMENKTQKVNDFNREFDLGMKDGIEEYEIYLNNNEYIPQRLLNFLMSE